MWLSVTLLAREEGHKFAVIKQELRGHQVEGLAGWVGNKAVKLEDNSYHHRWVERGRAAGTLSADIYFFKLLTNF